MSAASTTSGVDTGSVSFGGLGSGTDFGAMIDQLREVEEYHINSLERWKTDWQGRVDAITMITDLMSELEIATSEISSVYDVIQLVGTTSDESSVTASATSSAIPATYTLEVQQLASSSIFSTKTSSPFVKNASNEFEKLLPEGSETKTFEYTHGVGDDAVTLSIEIDDTMTIEDLVTRINNDAKNPGVKASLVGTGSGYVFQFQSTETGSVNALEINTDIPGMESGAANWNELEAKDAKFVLNGFSDQVLTSYSNSVTEVIEGVTLNLKNTTSAPTTISINQDYSKVQEAITSWVDSVNELRSMLNTLTAVDSDATAVDPNTVVSQDEADIGSILTGNYAVQLMESRFNDVATSAGHGYETIYTKIGGVVPEKERVVGMLSEITGENNFTLSNVPDSIPVKSGGYDLTYDTDATGKVQNVKINGIDAVEDVANPGTFIVEDDTSDFDGFAVDFGTTPLDPNISRTDTVTVENKSTTNFKVTNIPNYVSPSTAGYDVKYQTDGSGNVHSVTINGYAATEDPRNPGAYIISGTNTSFDGFEIDFGDAPLEANLNKTDKATVQNGDVQSYSLMSELGISTDVEEGSATYGLLVIDQTKLLEAIEANPMAVAELLAGSSVEAKSENFIFSNATDSVQAGNYNVTYETDADGKLIVDTLLIDGKKPASDPNFPNRFTVSDSTSGAYGLAIEFTSGVMEANKSFSDSVNVKEGKAQEFNTFLQNEMRDVAGQAGNGALPIVRSNYEDIIDALDKKIADEEDRLDLWETRMRARYASLDAHLGVQSALMESNAAALAQANLLGT